MICRVKSPPRDGQSLVDLRNEEMGRQLVEAARKKGREL